MLLSADIEFCLLELLQPSHHDVRCFLRLEDSKDSGFCNVFVGGYTYGLP